MSAVIVYDSVFGNTAAIARTIGAGLEAKGRRTRILTVQQAHDLSLADVDLLVVGSPTRGFRPTPSIDEWVGALKLPDGAYPRAAAFDTRIDPATVHPAPLRWVVEAGGYAAQRIAAALGEKGFSLSGEAGFVVVGTEGPLKQGESDRAKSWGESLAG